MTDNDHQPPRCSPPPGGGSRLDLAAPLAEAAAADPGRDAIIFLDGRRETAWSFGRLNDEAELLARGLPAVGVTRGTRAVLMVRPGPEFFALTFAMFRLGAVPVLVDPGMGRKSLGDCLDAASPEAFIAVPLAHAAAALLGWARRTVRTRVVVGPRFLPGQRTLAEVRALGERGPAVPGASHPDDTAAILFTSGSTGVPKGAVYTHGNFAAQVAMLRDHFGIRPGEIDLPTFPLFALFAPALGMTAVIPEMDFTRPGRVDPENIIGPVLRHKVTHLFGSPALLARVGRHGQAGAVKLPSLKRVVSAGAPVPPKVVEAFQSLLAPGVQVHTPYGATEALPVCSIGSDEILSSTRALTDQGAGACVGRPFQGVELRIIRIDDSPVPRWSDDLLAPPGAVGEIVVRGPNVTRSYFGRPASDALAKIDGGAGGVYHRMGDLGRLDDKGRVWFCGRKAHRIVAGDRTLFSVPCEGVFNAHRAVSRSALVGVGFAPRQRPVIVVELEQGRRGSPELKDELLRLGAANPVTAAVKDLLFHPSLPVDIRHNAKIDREALAAWAGGALRSP
ncbi:MAG: AMP-binding protein [Elusimicrobia bacterium]|nr:AMP-binding protein [Elusimicrobiota bacterium]